MAEQDDNVPEGQYLSEEYAQKHPKREKTIYQTKGQHPRWVLQMQATMWRNLMRLGMFFHRLAPPRPPDPDFEHVIPSTLSGNPGNIPLYFYVPRDYHAQKQLWMDRVGGKKEDLTGEETEQGTRRRSTALANIGETILKRGLGGRRWGGYPVVINFHGGGFTLGMATDDARWCGTVVNECDAVVVSVAYRLAPKCPFPAAVEDGVDAVLWVHQHAEELGINRDNIALSGFSSGANMAFTVPLRLYDHQTGFARVQGDASQQQEPQDLRKSASAAVTEESANDTAANTTKEPPSEHGKVEILDPNDPPSDLPLPPLGIVASPVQMDIPQVKIKCIVPWYPPTDYTRTREERRATCRRIDQELPALFTDLFDDSYLHPPKDVNLDSPYLSPGVAPTDLLRDALSHEIILHTCEWDMLLDEGEMFRDRLISPEIGKKVFYQMIPGVPHGWDKAPNPLKPTPGVLEHYLRACKEIRRVLEQHELPVRPTTEGPSAAPRGSVQVVR